MPKKSTIESLPPEIKAKVDAEIRAGRYTIDGLVVIIREAGAEGSRSAVGRYVVSKKKTMEIFAEANKMAESLADRFREDPESKVSKMLGQVVQGLTFNTMQQMAENEKAKPSELMLLSATIKNLAGAEKITFEREQKIRKLAQEEALKKLEKLADPKKAGAGAPVITPEALTIIRRDVYGLTDPQ